jgi:geranylgeranyl pyrophosphate synthase
MAAQLNGAIEDASDYARVVTMAASIEMLHTASLVHDDVIDDALLRRGAPTLNATWNKGSTVLAGDYMFGRSAYFSAQTNNMRVIQIFSDTLQVIVNGELRQLFARNDYHQDKDEYYRRIYAKTASLFCAASEGAAILANMSADETDRLRNFGYNFGMAFQIVDDILDFTGTTGTLGKPAGSDLRQGTVTLPFFYFLRERTDQDLYVAMLEERFEQGLRDNNQIWLDTVDQVVAELHAGNAIEDARREAWAFLQEAAQCLAPLTESQYKESMLGLCDFVLQRTF